VQTGRFTRSEIVAQIVAPLLVESGVDYRLGIGSVAALRALTGLCGPSGAVTEIRE